jgi:hypothetical protein
MPPCAQGGVFASPPLKHPEAAIADDPAEMSPRGNDLLRMLHQPIREPSSRIGWRLTVYTVSFSSLVGRKAIFLLALILMASPVAGFLPMRAASFRTWRIPRPVSPTLLPFFKCRGGAIAWPPCAPGALPSRLPPPSVSGRRIGCPHWPPSSRSRIWFGIAVSVIGNDTAQCYGRTRVVQSAMMAAAAFSRDFWFEAKGHLALAQDI